MSSVLKPLLLSHEEYFALEQKEDWRYEYIAGEIFAMAGGTESHALISSNILIELGNALRGKPCRIYGADMKLYIKEYDKYCYPDVQVLCEQGIQHDQYVENPALIVEIFSKSTEAYDRSKKFEHYRSIETLKYYVLVDQDQRHIEVYQREDQNRWLVLFSPESVDFPEFDARVGLDSIYQNIDFKPVKPTKLKSQKDDRPWDKNVAPYGWYVGAYLLRFIECDDPEKNNPEKLFITWENTIILEANDLNDAYDKIVQSAMLSTEPYKGGAEGIDVQWLFEGVTELLPIYEELEDGAEIIWAERWRKLKTIPKLVRKKGEFHQ